MKIANMIRIGGSYDAPLMAGENFPGLIYVAVVPEGERPSHCTWQKADEEQAALWCSLYQEYIRNTSLCPDTGEHANACACGWH